MSKTQLLYYYRSTCYLILYYYNTVPAMYISGETRTLLLTLMWNDYDIVDSAVYSIGQCICIINIPTLILLTVTLCIWYHNNLAIIIVAARCGHNNLYVNLLREKYKFMHNSYYCIDGIKSINARYCRADHTKHFSLLPPFSPVFIQHFCLIEVKLLTWV